MQFETRANGITFAATGTVLNGPQFVEAARVFGEKLLAKHRGDRTAVIEDAFYHLTSRKPDPEEVEILVNLYEAQHQEFDANPADANALLEVGYAPISLYETRESMRSPLS